MSGHHVRSASNRMRAYGALAAALIMIISSTVPAALANGFGNYPVPPNQDWIISNATAVSNESLLVDGDVIIESGGSLTLTNIILFINSTTDGEHGVFVQEGGAFTAINTTILPFNTSNRLKFESFGNLNLVNSTFLHLWGSGASGSSCKRHRRWNSQRSYDHIWSRQGRGLYNPRTSGRHEGT